MTMHAKLSPSGAERWINCPPSAQLGERFPDTTSSYAEEGTLAHRVAEITLGKALGFLSEEEAAAQIEEAEMSLFYSKDMPGNLEPYVEYILSQAAGAEFVGLEEKLNISEWVPDGFGTSDAVIIKDGTLEVVDLKYGQGVPVSAKENPQFRLYGLGAVQEWHMLFPFQRVRCTVVQPRLDNISSEELTVEELLGWAAQVVRPAAILADKGEGEYKSGEHCRWCKAKAICRRRAEDNMALARHEFAEPALLTNEDIADILAAAGELKAWAGDVEAYALEQALKGVSFHGFKLVEGRSLRQLTNEEEAVRILLENGVDEEKLYIRSLVGIPAMEKLVGKRRLGEILKEHIVKPQGKPTLVKETDKRPAMNSAEAAAREFKEEEIKKDDNSCAD